MKNLLIPFLFAPFFCFAQISISTGLLATGQDNFETGLMYTGTITLKNEALSSGLKFGKSNIKEVDFTYLQFFIGPHFQNFHIGLTIDQTFARYENLKLEYQGIGLRFAGYFPLVESFGVIAEVNPGISGDGQKYIQLLTGVSYNFKQ